MPTCSLRQKKTCFALLETLRGMRSSSLVSLNPNSTEAVKEDFTFVWTSLTAGLLAHPLKGLYLCGVKQEGIPLSFTNTF